MNNKIYAAIGVSDFKSYFLKFFLPIFFIDFLIFLLFVYGIGGTLGTWLGISIFILILFSIYLYPVIIIDNQSRDIENNLHYFITYAGALSTVNLDRKELFMDLSEKIRYQEISKIFKKLLYLVESIKVDFSTSSYKMAELVKTEHFARFLERMGIALSFNANVAKFFLTEQKALMNSFEVVYRESLERIRLVQEIFISTILSFTFVLATVLLIPFLTGINETVFLQFGILVLVMIDIMMIFFAKYFLPKDRLYHDMGYDDGRKKVLIMFFISLLFILILAPIILILDLRPSLKAAIILTPFLLTGIYSNYQEKLIWKRDSLFPPFIRSLGDVHQSKGGTLTSTIETLLPHNFGILDALLVRVYKRLKITANKFNSWYFFSKESGSALISEFMDIFVSVVYRGGSAQKAGEIVSDNMARLNGLRDQKKEFISTFKGSMYGTYFGLALVLQASLLISSVLFNMFFSMTEGLEGEALAFLGSIFPVDMQMNLEISTLYLTAILIIHAFISSYLLKEVDGGNKFSMFSDVVYLLWIAAAVEFGSFIVFGNMFPGFFN
jgi:flagellar protein FlaJ